VTARGGHREIARLSINTRCRRRQLFKQLTARIVRAAAQFQLHRFVSLRVFVVQFLFLRRRRIVLTNKPLGLHLEPGQRARGYGRDVGPE
jgi:hypothetical protein